MQAFPDKQEKNKYDTMQYNQEKNKDDMTK